MDQSQGCIHCRPYVASSQVIFSGLVFFSLPEPDLQCSAGRRHTPCDSPAMAAPPLPPALHVTTPRDAASRCSDAVTAAAVDVVTHEAYVSVVMLHSGENTKLPPRVELVRFKLFTNLNKTCC